MLAPLRPEQFRAAATGQSACCSFAPGREGSLLLRVINGSDVDGATPIKNVEAASGRQRLSYRCGAGL